jgi:hypothetical protein
MSGHRVHGKPSVSCSPCFDVKGFLAPSLPKRPCVAFTGQCTPPEGAGQRPKTAVLFDHSTRPRNRRKLEHAVVGEGYNPFCGDRCTVYLDVGDGLVRDIGFEGTG